MGGGPPRLEPLLPSAMSADQRRLYNQITGGSRGEGRQSFPLVDGNGALTGPFNAMCLSPEVGDALQNLGAALRYRSTLTRRATEVAILTVAAARQSAFEQFAHEAVARDLGFTEAELAALRSGEFVGADQDEAVLASTVRQLLASPGQLDDDGYDRAVAVLGRPGLFDLIALVGYYSTLSQLLDVFHVALPGASPTEPIGATP